MADNTAGQKNPKKKRRRKLSAVSIFHYYRLTYRSMLFLGTLVWYIVEKLRFGTVELAEHTAAPILGVIWCVYMIEMVMRFFPARIESPGSQKQFRKNYLPTGRTDVQLHDNNGVMIAALIWIIFNGIFGALHQVGIFDDGIMLLISMAYAVCDMICILFFCPFQTWLFKNRCCATCRIYNWDYAMMFTPFFFMPGIFTWTLLIASVILLIRWEVTVWLYPERFSDHTNAYLACANCTEKLCHHKKQLKTFRASLSKYTEKQVRRILNK